MIAEKLFQRMTYKDLKDYSWNSMNKISLAKEDYLKESTYFKCIKYISESVAKCPLILKQDTENGEIEAKHHKLFRQMKLRPNLNMNAIDCIKAFIAIGEHNGISGLYIDRKTYQLYPCVINNIIIDNKGLVDSSRLNKMLLEVQVGDSKFDALEKDVVLYRSGITWDGISSKSNREMLQDTIETNIKGQKYMSNLFDNGLTNKIIVQLTSDIKEEKELKKVQAKFNRLFSEEGRTFTVPAGYNVSALNLSLSDVQYEQLRKLSRREIANCFGLSPSHIGDLEDSNNNNMEMQNLSFLVDTLLIKFEQIEQELDWKLLDEEERSSGYKWRFNQSVMLRTNAETQANILTAYNTSGIYTINDCREKLGLPKLEGGDDILVSSGVYKLKDLTAITMNKKGKGGE